MDSKEQFKWLGDSLLINAPAKINLSLLVGDKTPDNFHYIETIMAKVTLYDELLLEKTDSDTIELICQGQYFAPIGPENLVYKACQLLDITSVKITLTKNIPSGAGLAGGSSDAASTLIALNKLFKLGKTKTQLAQLASQIGSDISFFITGPLAICTGKGEKVQEIQQPFNFDAFVIMPDVRVSTVSVYRNFKPNRQLFKDLQYRIEELFAKKRIDLIAQICANMLAISCFELNKDLADFKEKLQQLCQCKLCLSGSGSAMYLLLDENTRASEIKAIGRKLQSIDGCKSVFVSNNGW